MFSGANGEQVLGSTFSALARRADGSYEVVDTALPLPLAGGRLLFADVNGDGLPDAIQSGQVHSRLVDTTGSPAGYAVGDVSLNLTHGAIVSPEQTQREAGFVIGLELDLSPFGGESWQLAEIAGLAAKSSDEARLGLRLRMLVGGIATAPEALGAIAEGLLSAADSPREWS